jgi:ketosteroid isomerase-like protein
MTKKEIMIKFYDAFSNGDWKTMNTLYHKDVVFNDEMFKNLNHLEVTSMWKMLIDGNKNMAVQFNSVEEDDDFCVNWIADYTFGPKQRKVHNDVFANMEIKDDKIISHTDTFVFSTWAKQALGFAGKMFGNTKWLRKKVSKAGRERLENFINKK